KRLHASFRPQWRSRFRNDAQEVDEDETAFGAGGRLSFHTSVSETRPMEAPLRRSEKVRVGIVGVGNCASSFIQGLTYYADTERNEPVPGMMNVSVGGYRVGDVEISAAFDINAHKVGRDVADAIWAPPNNTCRFADVRPTEVRVQRGRTLDGLGCYLKEDI